MVRSGIVGKAPVRARSPSVKILKAFTLVAENVIVFTVKSYVIAQRILPVALS